MTDWQSTFATTFVDEMVRNGVTDAVIAPGKRSTLIAAALERDARIRTHVIIDERSGAFFALGLSRKSGRPALIWSTSGTAAAELHPAVMEASNANVPLLVCTADRPPELHAVRDWQSMDQTHLYGNAVRWFFDMGVADEGLAPYWRSIVSRAYFEAMGSSGSAGPVHLNVPIREPFSLEAVEAVSGRDGDAPWHRSDTAITGANYDAVAELVQKSQGKRGIFVLGDGLVDADAVRDASEKLGWPVIAQPRSSAHGKVSTVIAAADALLRNERFSAEHRPDIVVHVGAPLLSRVFMAFWKSTPAEYWTVESTATWQGETQQSSRVVITDPSVFFRELAKAAPRNENRSWLQSWMDAERIAQDAMSNVFDAETQLCESGIARTLYASLPVSANLICSTSMPVRDIAWWSKPRPGVQVFANRGVSGLDGVTSTALGIAAAASAEERNVLLIGDLGVLHDLNALWATRGSSVDIQLTIVLVDNNGGGIFRIFPLVDELGEEIFERVVTTPQHVDIQRVANALDVDVVEVDDFALLQTALGKSIEAGGVRMIYCRTDVSHNMSVMKKVVGAVTDAVNAR